MYGVCHLNIHFLILNITLIILLEHLKFLQLNWEGQQDGVAGLQSQMSNESEIVPVSSSNEMSPLNKILERRELVASMSQNNLPTAKALAGTGFLASLEKLVFLGKRK
jgi:hypothetical protein